MHEILVMFVSRERVATGLPIPCWCRAVGIGQGKFGFFITVGLPLFPTSDGEVCAKVEIIKCLEATLSACGVSTVAETGSGLFRGHSFRVAGAQRLVTIGVEIDKIMVMARWAGSTVLRYVKKAPLANLSSEVMALEEHNGSCNPFSFSKQSSPHSRNRLRLRQLEPLLHTADCSVRSTWA